MNIERCIEEGKQIVETYCKSDEANEPMMFPPSPNLSPYIDKFQENLGLNEDNRNDKRHQEDYEAEVTVYRAIEGLKEDIFVLHSFEYTHGQYQLFGGDHYSSKNEGQECKLKNQEKEGENDFLVIGRNYFVIIEVKNMKNGDGSNRQTQINPLTGTFNKSYKQGGRTKTLIENIVDHVGGDRNTPIKHFSAFPNFKKEFIDEFELDEEKKKVIICKEDFDCLDKWWKDNVTDHVSVSHPIPVSVSCLDWLLQTVRCGRRQSAQCDNYAQCDNSSHMIDSAVSHVLLALWCCEQKKRGNCYYNKTKFCLRECIKKTDGQLSKALITQKRKNAKTDERCKNQAVDPAPHIFQEYLKIKNLTNQQRQAFRSDQKFLWINGAAGSGKSILILGKVIELAQAKPKRKIVVIKAGPSPQYRETLQNAGLTVSEDIILYGSGWADYTGPDRQFNADSQYILNSILRLTEQVVLLQLRGDLYTVRRMKKISGIITTVANAYHVFFDDTQFLFRRSHNDMDASPVLVLRNLLTTLCNRPTTPTTSTVWWACDIVQLTQAGVNKHNDIRSMSSYVNNLQRDVLAPEQLIVLSTNLRNTCDISNMVSAIRDYYIKLGNIIGKRLVLYEDNGHFIHGPMPVIHVVSDNYKENVSQIVDKELKKLCDQSDGGQHSINIGLIVRTERGGNIAVRLRELDTVKRKQVTVVSDTDDIYSREWPAVLVVADLRKINFFLYSIFDYCDWLSRMYISLSRGRVYCSAILMTGPNPNKEFLDILKSVARIKMTLAGSPPRPMD